MFYCSCDRGFSDATARQLAVYSHGFGLGVESGELFDVQLPVAVTVELLQQGDDLGRREVERGVL